jgi:hypothetical protein
MYLPTPVRGRRKGLLVGDMRGSARTTEPYLQKLWTPERAFRTARSDASTLSPRWSNGLGDGGLDGFLSDNPISSLCFGRIEPAISVAQ